MSTKGKGDELLQVAKAHLYGNYKPAPFVVERGRGCELFDVDGRRCLDLDGRRRGVVARACAPDARRGHRRAGGQGHPRSNYFYNEPNIRLADELCRRTGYDRAFFCNSGAEANEALLKIARHHFYRRRRQAAAAASIAFHNAFHGRTMGALSMTGTPKYREGFGEMGPVTHVAVRRSRRRERGHGARRGRHHRRAGAGRGRRLRRRRRSSSRGCATTCDAHGALLLRRRGADGHRASRALPRSRRMRRARRRDRAREGARRRRSHRRDADDREARRSASARHARLHVRRQSARVRGVARRASQSSTTRSSSTARATRARRSAACSTGWSASSRTSASRRAVTGSCAGSSSSRGSRRSRSRSRGCSSSA